MAERRTGDAVRERPEPLSSLTRVSASDYDARLMTPSIARTTAAALLALISFTNLPPAWAQGADRPVATARRVVEAPTIDGLLDETVWRESTPLMDFVQAEPLEGQPATEGTEVQVLYDDVAIFIGARMHDGAPAQIVTTDTSRDAGLGNQDSFQVIFDTFQDRQNGFVFGTNATGIQYDAQVRNQGNPRTSWDGSWEVRTRLDEDGWTAEFRIPLRTLRYGPPPQVWGVNFMRNIQRRRERSYWAPMPRQFNLGRLTSAGDLTDLDLQAPRNLKVLPYVVSSANRGFAPGSTTDIEGDFGLDAKVGVTGSMNLDLTYNTDFAQVEVDTQQINLTRYSLRFPERRPFFLENSELFNVGASGRGFRGGGDLDLFFSRRIGLDEDGNLVPIKGGARLSGKANGFNIGMLNMQTDDLAQSPGNNFTNLRVSRDLPNRSGVGALFINRTATGEFAGEENWNRTWGLDGRLGVGERITMGGFASRNWNRTWGLDGRLGVGERITMRVAHRDPGAGRTRLRVEHDFRVRRRQDLRRLPLRHRG